MDPMLVIRKYYKPGSKSYCFLVEHSKSVTGKALEVAHRFAELHPEAKLDFQFIEEAAMLHDIGIFLTDAPKIGCHGKEPYVRHGWLGAELLRKEKLPRHALVCERHVGAGITRKDIEKERLKLPKKDMIPVSLEEKIVCFSDKFFSKRNLGKEESVKAIRKELSRYKGQKERFEEWLALFGYAVNQNVKESIKTIHKILGQNGIRWALVGSANMQFQGMQVEPRDLDIVLQHKDLDKMTKLFSNYSASNVKELDSLTGKKVWEVNATINDVEIQFLGADDKDVYVSKLLANKLVLIGLDGVKIPCFTLEAESQCYKETNRGHKARLIQEFLSMHRVN